MVADIRIGDRVRGERSAYDEWVTIEGVVTGIDEYRADGQPRANINIKTDAGYTDWFGLNEKTVLLSRPAPQQTAPQKQGRDFSCHYCGMPAKSFGFFDEPVCRDCGG